MATQESTPQPAQEAETAACCHHWSIQPATGPVSQGVCKNCGELREFKNYVEAATWGDSRLSNRANTDDSQASVKPVSNKEDKKEDKKDGDEAKK